MAKQLTYQIQYDVRVRAIQRAIANGHEFFLDTFWGRKLVKSMDGDWAITGEGLGQRSFMLCSSHIYPWAEELGIPQEKQLKIVTEACPHCGGESEIPADFASPCLTCGMEILPCSGCEKAFNGKCDWNEKSRCSKFPIS